MRPSALFPLLAVLFTNLVQVESELVRGRVSQRQRRRTQERTNFESFFNVIYVANENGEADLVAAAETLIFAYNGKFLPRYSNDEAYVEVDYFDPYDRRMEFVEVVEVESRRVLSEEEIRSLQSTQLKNLNVFLRVTGSCTGCPSRTRFTNQVSRRQRHRRRLDPSGKGGKGKGGSIDSTVATAPPSIDFVERDDTITSPVPITTPAPIQTPAPVPPPTALPTGAPIEYVDPADLPTEAELLAVYAQEIRNRNLNIVDVLSLDEIDN